MHADVAKTFKEAVVKAIPVVQELLPKHMEPSLIWTRNPPQLGSRGWRADGTLSPSWTPLWMAASPKLLAISSEFSNAFVQHYSEYQQNFAIGRTGKLFAHGSQIDVIAYAIRFLYEKYGTLPAGEDEIDAVAQEWSSFLDEPTVKVDYLAQLMNFSADVDEISLSNGVVIRKLTESEVTAESGN